MMSRRKQSKPRAVKREDEEDVLFEEDTGPAMLREEEEIPPTDTMATEDMSHDDYRCEHCAAVFTLLGEFMDHYNSCGAGSAVAMVTLTPCELDEHCQVSGEMRNEEISQLKGDDCLLEKSPGSSNCTHSPVSIPDQLTSSGGISNLPVDQIPFTIGVNENSPYGCQFCDKAFSRLSFLKKHEQTHSDQMPFRCDFCQRLFKHKRSRDRHIKLHTGDKKYKCPQCEAAFSRSDHLKIHIRTHDSSKAFQCIYCNRGYTTSAALTSHMVIHKKSDSSPNTSNTPDKDRVSPSQHEIQLCGNKRKLLSPNASNQKVSRKNSRKDSSTEKIIKSAQYRNSSVNMSIQLEGRPPPCPYCNKMSFDTIEVLEIHVLTMHEGRPTLIYHCKYCEDVFTSQYQLNEHVKISHEGHTLPVYPCNYCVMDFNDEHSLKLHTDNVHRYMAISRENDNYSEVYLDTDKDDNTDSPVSPLLMKMPDLIKSHGNESHGSMLSPESPHLSVKIKETCHQCNATFTDLSSFEAHMKMHGVVLEKFSCSKCSSGFSTEEDLETHAITHYLSVTNEYVCTNCKKVFNQPDDLQKHLIDIHAHHMYRCSLCKETFESKVDIQVHFGVKHSNTCKFYNCSYPQCNAPVFRSELEWELHVKVNHLHISNPYRCLFCKERFSSEMDLQCHLTTHKKQFPCSMCDESFHVEFMRDKHLIETHSNDSESSLINDEDVQVIDLSNGAKLPSPLSKSSTASSSTKQPYFLMDVPAQRKTKESASKNPGWLLCPLCPARFHNNFQLNNHAKYKHSIKLPQSSSYAYYGHRSTTTHQNESVSQAQKNAFNKTALSSSKTMKVEDNSLSKSLELNPLCVYCNKNFKSKLELERHMKIHFSQQSNGMKCHVCDQKFHDSVNLTQHKLTEHCKVEQGRNMCAFCKTVIESEEHFYVHARQHGSIFGKANLIQCLICSQSLTSKLELEMHGSYHFQSQHSTVDSYQGGFDGPSLYTCCVCSRSFMSIDSVVCKLNSSRRPYYVCKPCYSGHEDQAVSPEIQTEPHRDKFNTDSTNGVRTDNLHIACSVCQGLFTTCEIALGYSNSSSINNFPVCHSCFNDPQKDLLSPQRKYKCKDCLVKFETQSELNDHMPVHAKTYSCIKCDRTFAAESDIQEHVLEHIQKEALLKCRLCTEDVYFDSPVRLQRHLLSHEFPTENFECSVCNNGFQTASCLQSHIMEHASSLKKHQCSLCNKKYFFRCEIQNHNLEEHITDSHISDSSQSNGDIHGPPADP